jgi:hypothetical protein
MCQGSAESNTSNSHRNRLLGCPGRQKNDAAVSFLTRQRTNSKNWKFGSGTKGSLKTQSLKANLKQN